VLRRSNAWKASWQENQAGGLASRLPTISETRFRGSSMTIVYEVRWHEIDDVFSHCTIDPIVVLAGDSTRRGLAKLMNQNGDVYQSNLSSYYKSEEEALEAIKGDMEETIERYESDIEELQVRLQAHRNYLEELENEA
jgi:hypothetical protein